MPYIDTQSRRQRSSNSEQRFKMPYIDTQRTGRRSSNSEQRFKMPNYRYTAYKTPPRMFIVCPKHILKHKNQHMKCKTRNILPDRPKSFYAKPLVFFAGVFWCVLGLLFFPSLSRWEWFSLDKSPCMIQGVTLREALPRELFACRSASGAMQKRCR